MSRRILFVSNGYGEAAIADALARNVKAESPNVDIDHLALVGEGHSTSMRDVGPQRTLPSGGIIAMGNFANIARDVRGGLIGLTVAQRRFLVASRDAYDASVAVGDVYALLMTLALRAPTIFVGTAKSVLVAPYGRLEERVLRRACAIFVRDEPTAERLRAHGVAALAPGNVIVDLYAVGDNDGAERATEGFAPAIALFPGSRTSAYDDAAFLMAVLSRTAAVRPQLGAALSIAPTLQVERVAARLRAAGWEVREREDALLAFSVWSGARELSRAWCGAAGALLPHVALVAGQAGTANEAAAAVGIPVVAFERGKDRKTAWYRMRQHGLLGEALAILPGDMDDAARGLGALLDDPEARVRMSNAGRARMGPSGGARVIARRIVEMCHAD